MNTIDVHNFVGRGLRWNTVFCRVIILFVSCACLLGCSHKRTYAEDVEEFEARVRKEVNPELLQNWAVDAIREQAKKAPLSENTLSYEVRETPKMLQGIWRYSPSIYVFVNRDEKYSFVAVHWGSTFAGHWGLNVGSTNFVDYTGQGSEMWRPGVYFWRSFRPEK